MAVVEYKEKLCETVLYYRKQNFKLVFYNDKCTKFDLYDAFGRKSYTYEFKDTIFNGIYAFPGPHGTYFVTRNSYLFVLKYPACRGFKPILLDNTIIRIRNPEKNVESVFYYGEHSFAYVRKVFNAKSKRHHYVCFHCNHDTLVRSIAKSKPEEEEDKLGKLQSLYSNEHVLCITSLKKAETKLTRVTFQVDPDKPYRQWYLANFSSLPMSFSAKKNAEDGTDPVFMDSEKELVIIQPGTSICWKMTKESGGVSSANENDNLDMKRVELPNDIHKKVAEKHLVANFSHENALYMTDNNGSVYKLDLNTLSIEPIGENEDVSSIEYVSKLRSSVFTNDRAEAMQQSTVVSSLNSILDAPALSSSSRPSSTQQPPLRKIDMDVGTTQEEQLKQLAVEPKAAAKPISITIKKASKPEEEKEPEITEIPKEQAKPAEEVLQPLVAENQTDAAALMIGAVSEAGLESAAAPATVKELPTEDDSAPVACDAAALMIGVVASAGLE